MSNAAPPAWVLALPIGSGQWRYLVKAWGYGPFKNAKPDAPPLTEAARAKACNATIAARSGQPKSTAAKQALALAGAGWVRRDADGYLTLASWRAPHVFTLDAAVEAGLVVRGDDGALSWPHPASGATQPTDGVPHTTDGSTRSRGAPNPPVVHPQPATGATHTTDGSQSCLSSLSSFGLEVEARDPHDLAAALEAAPTPPRKPSSNMVVSGKPRAPRRQAREQSGVLEPVDPWPARVREASASAHYHLAMSDGPAPSYGGLLTQAVANYGAERVLLVLRAWEADLPEHRPRPPANKLWWKSWTSWVERELGITAPKPEAATQAGHFPMRGSLPDLSVVS